MLRANEELFDELILTGYQAYQTGFTPKQVEIICKHLGFDLNIVKNPMASNE